MKSLTLFFLVLLSSTILIACEKLPPLPVKDVLDPSQTNTQFVQRALSDLAGTAAERKFVDLANAANGVTEILAVDDGTSVEPLFSKIAKLAHEATVLERAFAKAGCEYLRKFAEASMNTVRAYTIRDAAGMEKAWQNLAQEVLNAETVLHQLTAENGFIPFAFGYGLYIDAPEGYYYIPRLDYPQYKLGEFWVVYDSRIHPVPETSADVIEFLTDKGYNATPERGRAYLETVYLGAAVDMSLIVDYLRKELLKIPGVAVIYPIVIRRGLYTVPDLPPKNVRIINRVRERYNEMWCQGNFDAIDSILTDESELDFFDYAFVRNLADIYAEEIPETAKRIEMNHLSLRSIALEFLEIYFENSENTLDETIELFRQSVISGNIDIEHKTYDHYYLTTNYWKQLVTDLMNQ